MINCEQVLQEYWNWIENPDAHPDSLPIREHLEHCSSCAAAGEEIRQLRSALHEVRDTPSAGFEARLRERLDAVRAGEQETDQPANVIRMDRSSFWKRPLALVATGAAAVLLIGLIGPDREEEGLPGLDAPVPGRMTAAGVQAEREWQVEDSLRGPASVDQESREDVIPVSTAP